MNDEFTPILSDQTQCLRRELYGDPVGKVTPRNDSDLRASQVDLYAERLRDGLDIWSGEPLAEDCGETTRMPGLKPQPGNDERRPNSRHRMVKVA